MVILWLPLFFANNSCRPSAYLASLPGTGGLQFIQIACMARCHVLHVIALSEVDEKPTCRCQATVDYTALACSRKSTTMFHSPALIHEYAYSLSDILLHRSQALSFSSSPFQ